MRDDDENGYYDDGYYDESTFEEGDLEDILPINRTSWTLDLRIFAECRTCGTPMIGIHSIAAREDCCGCGGEALNVRESPKWRNPQWRQYRL